ncbi:MAG: hypothetical protein WBV06_15045 [Acidimicrobiia bacterium]
MSMHEHDQELIMALAEGTLDEAAAAAARTEISACAGCSRDLELQRIAITALEDLPAVYLSAAESSRLHDALKRDLDMATPQTAGRRRRIAWGRWIPVAGVVAVLLVAVLTLPNMTGGDNSTADMTMAAAETTTTTSMTAEAQVPRDGATATGSSSDYAAAPNAGGTETTAAAETTQDMLETTTAAGQDSAEPLPYLGEVSGLDYDQILERVVTEMDDLRLRSLEALRSDGVLAECLAIDSSEFAPEFGLPENSTPIALGVVTDTTGEELVLVAYVPEDVTRSVFVTMRSPGCELVATLFR